VDIGNSMLWGPEQLMNWVVAGASLLPFSDGVAGRIFDRLNRTSDDAETFTRFLERFHVRERGYLESLEFRGEIDGQEVWNRQQKMVWGALGDAFFGRFRRAIDGGLREAYDLDQWQGSDFVVAPALMAGMTYFGGAKGRWNLGPASGRFELAPLRQVQEQWNKEDFSAALAIAAGLNRSPILLVVTVGLYDGDPELDFVGIGTGIGEVRDMLRERA